MKIIDMDAHPPFDTTSIDYIGELNQTKFFDRLERAGIDMVCGTLIPPVGFFENYAIAEVIQQLNKRTMEMALSEPRYIPVLWVHPDCVETSLLQLEKYVSMGAQIIEIDAAWLEREEMHHILSTANEQNVMVSLRGGTPDQIIALKEKFPLLKILVGGISDRVFTPECAKKILTTCSQVYLRLSGTFWSWNYVLHEWSKSMDKERLLFGTGYPYCNPATKLAAILWELRDQSNEEKELIFSKNVMKMSIGRCGSENN